MKLSRPVALYQKKESTSKKVEFEKMMINTTKETDIAKDSPIAAKESDEVEVLTQEPQRQPNSITTRKPRREIRRPARFTDMVGYAVPVVDEDIPTNFQEAIRSLESARWKKAIDEEMQSLQKNKTWRLAQLPKDRKAVGCKWVYTKKEEFHNKKEVRYKVRLVAKGYTQKEGVDYNEVFSPVEKHSSIRILLALVA